MKEFQIVLLSSDDKRPDKGFFTNILSNPLYLGSEWSVCLEFIIIPDLQVQQLVLVTIDCTENENNGDIIAFFKHKNRTIPNFTRIWQRVHDSVIQSISLRIQDFQGQELDLFDNKIIAILKFRKDG